MKKIFEKIKSLFLGRGDYGFLDEQSLPKVPFTEKFITGALDQKFIVTSDHNDIAKNHCGATAATNLGLLYLDKVDQSELFAAMYEKIGQGPVILIGKKISDVFKTYGKSLCYYRTRNLEKILAGLKDNSMAILLLASGIFAWHYVMALGYRIYEDGESYLIIQDGWHKNKFFYYKINQGSLLLAATIYKLEGRLKDDQ
ncbi:MAG: hypothetical protein Q4E36_05760 [Bacillota bacterium]|nr:hypothetical protein [Bacillota bacterium]